MTSGRPLAAPFFGRIMVFKGALKTLSLGQIAALLALSVSFWFSGWTLIRELSYFGWWGGWGSALMFALSFPIAAVSILGVTRLLTLRAHQVLPAVIFITLLVAMIDGATFTWTPTIYWAGSADIALAEAWSIGFVGIVMACALAMCG